MSETTTTDAGVPLTPLHILAAAYSAYYDLDPQHTAQRLDAIAQVLTPECREQSPNGWVLTTAGVMLATIKLESARAMGRLRTSSGQSTYRR